MNTISCNSCGALNDHNCAKCESCKNDLLDEETPPPVENWEHEFRFIEEAEMQGNVFEISDIDNGLCKVEPYESMEINQDIKHEPEIQIEPDNENEEDSEPKPVSHEHEAGNMYKCNECRRSFKREAALKSHVNFVHNGTLSTSPKASLTPKTPTKLDENSVDKLKESSSNGFWKCEECNLLFSVRFDYKMHKNQHEGKEIFQCDICKAYLSNKKILVEHKTKLHNSTFTSIKVKKFHCSICGERFSLQAMLSNHKKTHVEYMKQLHETTDIQRIDGRLRYICKTCGKISANRSRHEEHLRVHTKERPFKCGLCEAEFTTASSLVLHMRLHSDERPFKCEICSQTYRHRKNLKRHLLKHSGRRPFKCPHCDKSFDISDTMKDHVRLRHTGETPYKCELCERGFETSLLLSTHRRLKHNIVTKGRLKVEILINKVHSENKDKS